MAPRLANPATVAGTCIEIEARERAIRPTGGPTPPGPPTKSTRSAIAAKH